MDAWLSNRTPLPLPRDSAFKDAKPAEEIMGSIA
jgi:hypothetical protein